MAGLSSNNNGAAHGDTAGPPRVACILVNYRSPWEMLERCLLSIREAAAEEPCRVIVVDNASGDGVLDRVRAEFPEIELIELSDNDGFAVAVNRGLAAVTEPYVLMLNTDAVLLPGALASMAGALDESGDDCAGVAPKMMSSSHDGIIDAVGTVMPPTGASFNRGIGQCDLGQYDRRETVAGVCFGAALIRRRLFADDAVGPLYEGYFLYFEDSDWCLRAASRGYRFRTVPEAVVLHMHSGVTRNEALAFKYRLIELNTLRQVVRNFESRLLVARIVASRCARLIARTFIRRRFIAANISTMATFVGELPRLLGERREIQLARTVSDRELFKLAEGEDAYFDTVAYEPHRCLESLIDTYLRLLRQDGNAEVGLLLAELYRLQARESSGLPPAPAEELQQAFSGQPPCVRELLAASRTRSA